MIFFHCICIHYGISNNEKYILLSTFYLLTFAFSKVADINSDKETDSELTETREPGNEDIGIYRQTTSCLSGPQVEENILMPSCKFQIPEE